MRALCLITVKPGTIDKVTVLLSKKRKIAKEVLPVTGRADICVLMNGPIDDNLEIDTEKVLEERRAYLEEARSQDSAE